MRKQDGPLQTQSLTYHAPREVHLGDVFYKIAASEHNTFHEPCLVCKDAKELTVNGVTFKCPCCGNTSEVLTIHNFLVRRYRVYKITQEVGTLEWKPDTNVRTEFHVYRKVGHGHWNNSSVTTKFGEYELMYRLNQVADLINIHTVDRDIFDDYKAALAVAKSLNAQELQKLEKYNAEHGTTYAAEFRQEHDRPSK